MNFKFIKSTNLTALIAAVMTLGANPVFAEEPSSDVDALEREVDYIEALVDNGYSDFASDVIAKAKEKWPSAKNDPRIFALEVRGLLGIEKYEEAEKKIAELPKTDTDEYWQTFWAAKLELANNYFARGRKAECIKIYEDFFAKYPTPPEGIRRFHMQASYSFGQLLVADKKIQQAAERYESFLSLLAKRKNLTEDEENTWCNVATETAEMYLRLAAEKPKIEDRKVFLKKANKIIGELLWKQDMYVYFGRAIALRAHMQLLGGNIAKAQETIDEYMPQLQSIHDNLVAAESQGYPGVLKLSPMPQCRFLLAQMLWDEAKVLYEKTPRDDEKIKSLLFGEKKGAKRSGAGAYNHSLNVFIRYPESPWAAKAATLTDEIERFAIEKYKAKINKQITPEQLAKVREGQFRDAGVLFADGKYEEAIEAYWTVLAEYPEYSESIQAIENVIDSYQSLMIRAKEGEEAKVAEWRIDCDAIEGYLS
jgi:tetratricopeptide (TPR) repeat protein